MANSELAELQAALIDACARATSPEQALQLLGEARLSESGRRWLIESDPRSLATAIALVRRWGEWETNG